MSLTTSTSLSVTSPSNFSRRASADSTSEASASELTAVAARPAIQSASRSLSEYSPDVAERIRQFEERCRSFLTNYETLFTRSTSEQLQVNYLRMKKEFSQIRQSISYSFISPDIRNRLEQFQHTSSEMERLGSPAFQRLAAPYAQQNTTQALLDFIMSSPRTRALYEEAARVQRQNFCNPRLTISFDSAIDSACYNPSGLIRISSRFSFRKQVQALLHELCNAIHRPLFEAIQDRYARGEFHDADTYAQEVETMEFQTHQQASEIIRNCIQHENWDLAMLNGSDAFENLDHYLQAMEVNGHTDLYRRQFFNNGPETCRFRENFERDVRRYARHGCRAFIERYTPTFELSLEARRNHRQFSSFSMDSEISIDSTLPFKEQITSYLSQLERILFRSRLEELRNQARHGAFPSAESYAREVLEIEYQTIQRVSYILGTCIRDHGWDPHMDPHYHALREGGAWSSFRSFYAAQREMAERYRQEFRRIALSS